MEKMNSSLWGPSIWRIMFASVYSVDRGAHEKDVSRFLTGLLPQLLPCRTCRENMIRHIPTVDRRIRGEYDRPNYWFKWCWEMKHQVNRTITPPRKSLPFNELNQRYVLHGAELNEVETADVLMLVALTARTLDLDVEFCELCHILARLLPVPTNAALRVFLEAIQRPVINSAHRVARQTRIQHGRPVYSIAHYRNFLSSA